MFVIVELYGNIICFNCIKGFVDMNFESWVMVVESDVMIDDVVDEEVDEVNYYEVGVDDYLLGLFDVCMFIVCICFYMCRSMFS